MELCFAKAHVELKEWLSEKDGQKMREYINVLESRIDELEE